MEWTLLHALAVIFLATVIRSAFGFGEALIAVPLLALLIPVEEAVPLAPSSLSPSLQLSSCKTRKRSISAAPPFSFYPPCSGYRSDSCWVFLVLFGRSRQDGIVQPPAGLAFWVYSGDFWRSLWNEWSSPGDLWCAAPVGLPRTLRATLQGYFLPASIVGLLGYWLMACG